MWVLHATPQPLFPREKGNGNRRKVWAKNPVWMSTESLALTKIQIPNRPTRNDYVVLVSCCLLQTL
jgi:hypothetical protein